MPLVITASPTIPSKDLKELAAFLQSNKNAHYSYGSTGPGSFMHVIGEAFKRDANVEMTHVPLKGAAPLKQELLAGRLQVGGDQLSSSLADIKAGKLRALATNASKRIPELPDVPTVRELGYPGLEADGWNGLFAPAKTPRDVIDRLQRETAAAVKNPEVVKRFAEIGAESVGSSSADQDAILQEAALAVPADHRGNENRIATPRDGGAPVSAAPAPSASGGEREQPAALVGDARLPDHRRLPAVKRRRLGAHDARAPRGEEVGLGLERRRRRAGREVDDRRGRPDRVRERHQRPAVERAPDGAQVVADRELRDHALGAASTNRMPSSRGSVPFSAALRSSASMRA